jgi:DNA modification methylase
LLATRLQWNLPYLPELSRQRCRERSVVLVTARLLLGDIRERLAELPDRSVDLIVTSPPFLALRSYLPADHPDKTKEIGSEPNPAAYLDTLLELTEEWRRVLTPYGSICVELGDTYAGSGGAGGDYDPGGWRQGQQSFDGSSRREVASTHKYAGEWANPGYGDRFKGGSPGGKGWPQDKSLCGIPTLYPWSLAYGHNLLNPDHRITPWRIRNLLTWCRPNPPVGALGDKFRPATSFITVATMARDRWFDLDAVRQPYADITVNNGPKVASNVPISMGEKSATNRGMTHRFLTHAGAPPLDWDAPDNWDQIFAESFEDFRLWMLDMWDNLWDEWLADWWQPLIDLPTHPYKGAHYATFPPELPKRLIEAMCPRQVCMTCGEPRRRIVAPSERYATVDGFGSCINTRQPGQGMGASRRQQMGDMTTAEYVTLGWTDCGHNTWRPGHVLDPFAGSGTTLAVAVGCGRDATGIDLDPANLDLARERCGMFLETDA